MGRLKNKIFVGFFTLLFIASGIGLLFLYMTFGHFRERVKSLFKDKVTFGGLTDNSTNYDEPKRVDKGSEIQFIFKIKGQEKKQIDIQVFDGQITFLSIADQQVTKASKDFWPWESNSKHSTSKEEIGWSQTQSFTLPNDVDEESYTIKRSSDNFTVIFHKLKIETPGKLMRHHKHYVPSKMKD